MGLFRDFFGGGKQQERRTQVDRIDYSKMSDRELVEQFKEKNWEKLCKDSEITSIDKNGRQIITTDNSNKVALLQEIEKREAKVQGRVENKVVEINSGGGMGYHSEGRREIGINFNEEVYPERTTPSSVLSTYYHEQGHAILAHEKNQGAKTFDQRTVDANKVETAKGNYINPNSNFNGYIAQTAEMTSNTYSQERMLGNSEIFKDEKSFEKALEYQEEELKQARKYIDKNKNMLKEDFKDKTQKALANGDISKEECDRINIGTDTLKREPCYDNSIKVEQERAKVLDAKNKDKVAQSQESENDKKISELEEERERR